MGDFTTDIEKLVEAATRLDEGADLAEELHPNFSSGSVIPAAAYGGDTVHSVPAEWDVIGKLTEFMEGPYTSARVHMIATLSRTAVVMRVNSQNMAATAVDYETRDAQAERRFGR
jgi:hypothetical protein